MRRGQPAGLPSNSDIAMSIDCTASWLQMAGASPVCSYLLTHCIGDEDFISMRPLQCKLDLSRSTGWRVNSQLNSRTHRPHAPGQ
jgi:hypothetical protein